MATFRVSVAATLIILLAGHASAREFKPAEVATMRAFEGEWGFLSAKPARSLGTGLAGAAGECGAPKALRIDIRRDDRSIDPVRPWRVRLNPTQPIGPRIVKVENLDGRQRLTAILLGDTEVFERRGDRLTMIRGAVRLIFQRCPVRPPQG